MAAKRQERSPQFKSKVALAAVKEEKTLAQRSPEDGRIDWTQGSSDLYNFIRAQTKPYPGAFTFFGREKLTIWESRKIENFPQESSVPGEILEDSHRFLVQTGSGVLEILSVAYQGCDISAFDLKVASFCNNKTLSCK